ncbi:chorismate mutase [Sporolactobacillus shoreicorticis]|uniref:Chorismate mutase n=1 Tax=Sporolactobacillus shoreicorticis TaxID=1923877 RepID=A0ABW5RZC3_9BACL|nr:chorismate mutase [Sporolactobacillus shoreicorticis]MCO7126793.1 chorismate mutase [Sporolactobacillus shoreicorticis]
MTDLRKLRQNIDKIDEQLSGLINQRMMIARAVAQYKKDHNCRVLDTERENEIIQKACERSASEALKPYQEIFFRQLMALSRDYQREIIKNENDK